jgi:hypothetical protein
MCSLWKGIKNIYHFRIVHFPDFIPVSVSRVLRDYRLMKTESKLTFCCRHGLFWSFGLLFLFNGGNIDSFPPCF